MQTRSAIPYARLVLESLEFRLALDAAAAAVQLLPVADSAQQMLHIDLTRHPSGNDGQPDQIYIARDAGFVEISLQGRVAESLYRGEVSGLAGIELFGSGDGETVLVQGGVDLGIRYDGQGGFDHFVQLGGVVTPPLPTIDNAPPVALPYGEDVFLPEVVPTVVPSAGPQVLLGAVEASEWLPVDLALESPDFLGGMVSSDPVEDEDEAQWALMELLGGRRDEELILVRTPSGGGNVEELPVDLAFAELPAPQEEIADDTDEDAPPVVEGAAEEIPC